jgi:hypothetical protein
MERNGFDGFRTFHPLVITDGLCSLSSAAKEGTQRSSKVPLASISFTVLIARKFFYCSAQHKTGFVNIKLHCCHEYDVNLVRTYKLPRVNHLQVQIAWNGSASA